MLISTGSQRSALAVHGQLHFSAFVPLDEDHVSLLLLVLSNFVLETGHHTKLAVFAKLSPSRSDNATFFFVVSLRFVE